MGKKTDSETAERILRNGFVLPDQVEAFFKHAKEKAVATMLKARQKAKDDLALFKATAEITWKNMPDSEKVERDINWRGEKITRSLGYRQWYRREWVRIERRMPFLGWGENDAIRKVEEYCDERRVQFIIKVHGITGDTIKSATLHINPESGDVNGFIVGKDGTASVKTIVAGGYNIQCFHFRCLVREIKG